MGPASSHRASSSDRHALRLIEEAAKNWRRSSDRRRAGESGEAQSQGGSPARGIVGCELGSVRVGDLANDGQAQARAWSTAGLAGSVEAVEDKGQILDVDPGAVVADPELAIMKTDLDRPALGTPLCGIVEEVVDGAAEPTGNALHSARFEIEFEVEIGSVALDSFGREANDLIELHLVEVLLRLATPRELDDIINEKGQIVDLLDEIALELGSIALAQPAVLAQQGLEVGLECRQGRAQLVRGVGDKLALGICRALERIEQAVVGLSQAPDLIRALDSETAREIVAFGERLRFIGETADWLQRGSRNRPAEHRGQTDSPDCDGGQDQD